MVNTYWGVLVRETGRDRALEENGNDHAGNTDDGGRERVGHSGGSSGSRRGSARSTGGCLAISGSRVGSGVRVRGTIRIAIGGLRIGAGRVSRRVSGGSGCLTGYAWHATLARASGSRRRDRVAGLGAAGGNALVGNGLAGLVLPMDGGLVFGFGVRRDLTFAWDGGSNVGRGGRNAATDRSRDGARGLVDDVADTPGEKDSAYGIVSLGRMVLAVRECYLQRS